MVDGVLEIAAYCSLGVAVGLLLIKLFWPKLAPRAQARRFRHRLGKAEHVVASWADDFRAQDERRGHEQRHPEPTDD